MLMLLNIIMHFIEWIYALNVGFEETKNGWFLFMKLWVNQYKNNKHPTIDILHCNRIIYLAKPI